MLTEQQFTSNTFNISGTKKFPGLLNTGVKVPRSKLGLKPQFKTPMHRTGESIQTLSKQEPTTIPYMKLSSLGFRRKKNARTQFTP